MQLNVLLGVILLGVGAALLYFGYRASQGVGERIHETFTGRFTDSTTWYFIVGVAAALAGVAMMAFGSRA